jgi:hypothetical protein
MHILIQTCQELIFQEVQLEAYCLEFEAERDEIMKFMGGKVTLIEYLPQFS